MTLSSEETCGSCRFRMVNPQQITESMCRRYPPVSHLVPMQDKLGRTVPGFQSSFPQVAIMTPACGEYVPSVRMVS